MTSFKRTVEDFTCQHCGYEVTGNGYTNHCPQCLWSKHVDVHPGDRQASCGGMMPAVDFEIKNGGYTLVHRCEKCGLIRKNRLAENDNREILITLSEGNWLSSPHAPSRKRTRHPVIQKEEKRR